MKTQTLPRSIRVWFAVLLFSAATVCAIWAAAIDPWGRKPGEGASACLSWYSGCLDECLREYGDKPSASKGGSACITGCNNGYTKCQATPNISGPGTGVPGNSPPPTKTGPNSTPTPSSTPRRHPHPIRSPRPTPSATAAPVLRIKSAKSTPTPKPTPKNNDDSHSHHSH